MTKKIQLTGKAGGYALVDDDVYKEIGHLKWYHAQNGYAVRTVTTKGKATWLYMHRHIMGATSEVDHINQDKLDNRRKNLRQVSRSQNVYNVTKRSDNTSGHKGVYKAYNGKWRVQVSRKYYGIFDTFQEAVKYAKRIYNENF